jgi:hypothetical protein
MPTSEYKDEEVEEMYDKFKEILKRMGKVDKHHHTGGLQQCDWRQIIPNLLWTTWSRKKKSQMSYAH